MLTGTTRSIRSLLLMLFGISCHVAASSMPGSFALQGGEPSTQARLEITTAGKEHLTRYLGCAMTRAAKGPAGRDYQVELTKNCTSSSGTMTSPASRTCTRDGAGTGTLS